MYYGQIGNMVSESIGAKIRILRPVFFEIEYTSPQKMLTPPLAKYQDDKI